MSTAEGKGYIATLRAAESIEAGPPFGFVETSQNHTLKMLVRLRRHGVKQGMLVCSCVDLSRYAAHSPRPSFSLASTGKGTATMIQEERLFNKSLTAKTWDAMTDTENNLRGSGL